MVRLTIPKARFVALLVAFNFGCAGGIAKADFTFGEPVNLGPSVNRSSYEQGPCISADGLSLYFMSDRSGGVGDDDLWLAQRNNVSEGWGTPTNLGPPVNTPFAEFTGSISADGLELYLHYAGAGWGLVPRPGGQGETDIWVATRPTQDHAWGEPVNLGPPVNSTAHDFRASVSSDGLTLYFASDRPGGSGGEDLWIAHRRTRFDAWEDVMNLGPVVNAPAHDSCPSISADGLALFFFSDRLDGYGSWDLYMSRKTTADGVWSDPVNLGPIINTANGEVYPSISADGRTLYFGEYPGQRPGGLGGRDLWQVAIKPLVDFNGDETVDAMDIDIMMDCWGTDEPLCDIGPMPWGDGVVDVEDLVVLVEQIAENRAAVDDMGEVE